MLVEGNFFPIGTSTLMCVCGRFVVFGFQKEYEKLWVVDIGYEIN